MLMNKDGVVSGSKLSRSILIDKHWQQLIIKHSILSHSILSKVGIEMIFSSESLEGLVFVLYLEYINLAQFSILYQAVHGFIINHTLYF